MCPRYKFTFNFEYIDGSWSFLCIYSDNFNDAKKRFEETQTKLYFIKYIDKTDNWYNENDQLFEKEIRLTEGF